MTQSIRTGHHTIKGKIEMISPKTLTRQSR